MGDQVFIFSKEEFLILAAASGIHRMYGFTMREEPSERKAVLAMQGLSERKILLSVNDVFQVQEPVAALFRQIKEAKTTIDVHKRSGRKCIIYIGEWGVKVAISRQRPEMLEVQKIPIGQIWRFLTEEGWIPEEKEELH